MYKWLIAILIIFPIVEIWTLFSVGRVIGGWQTFGLVLLTGFVGAYLAKREGLKVWQLARLQLNAGQMPAGVLLDGICIFIGGILLIIPGFISDIAGVLLILPYTRGIAKAFILWVLQKRIAKGNIRIYRR